MGALQGKILQIVINQTVILGKGRKEAVFETLNSVLFATKTLSLQQKLGMRRTFCLISIVALLAFSCQTHRSHKSLAEVDSLVVAELYDSAYHLVNTKFEPSDLSPEEKAHYDLLRVQTSMLVNKPIESADSLLDGVISYYNQHVSHERLADAYYYKAIGAYKAKDPQQSIMLYKKAELHANQSGSLYQQFKIAEGISFVNNRCANFDLQLEYAKKALELSKVLGHKNWIAYSLSKIEMAYFKLGMVDSAMYYLNQIPSYIKYVDKKDLPSFLTEMGFLLKDHFPQKAKNYFKESLKYRDITTTYSNLADIAYDEGNHEEAYLYWKKALNVKDATRKDLIFANLIEYEIEHGRTDSISDYLSHIIHIHDSVEASLKNTAVRDIQAHFDQEIAIHEKDQTIIKWQWGILATILVIVVLAVYTIIKRYKASMVLKNYQMQIIDYTNQIREMELASEDYSKQIETLSQEVKQIMDERAPRLSEGRMLYDSVMDSKPIVKWSADDERKFIEYCTATNYRTVDRLRKEPRKEKLTDHRLIYLLLKEMGKSDKEVCDIMGLSDNGLRSMRNRTKPLNL